MMRKNSLFILLLVALLSFPVFAFADSSTDELSGGKGVGWQGIITSGDDTGLYGAVGRARNKYNMACWVFGKNPLTIPDEVRSKLSDPNYGGRFYEYANTFTSVISWEYVPDWQPTYSTLTYILYGFDFQWKSAVPQSLYEGAKADFAAILSGEDLGGGESGGTPDSPDPNIPSTLMFGHADYVGAAMYDGWFSNNSYNSKVSDLLLGGSIDISRIRSNIAQYVGSLPYVTYLIYPSNKNGGFYNNCNVLLTLRVFMTSSPPTYSVGGKVNIPSGYRFGEIYITPRINSNSSSLQLETNPNTSFNISNVNSGTYSYNFAYSAGYLLGNFISTGPPAPDGDWPLPDTPVTPMPPVTPTPTAPTVTPDPTPTEPTPTWPVITTPTAPTVVTVVTPEGLDYTQLLTLINDNLNDINSYIVAINSSLNSLRSDLVTEFEGVTQGLRNIYQYLQHLDDLLERHCKHLRDALDDGIYNLELYIKSLFEWLPQQLEFDAKFDYDDTAVTSLLRRILSKIPGGSGDTPTTYMPNPQSDEPGFFDWLTDLWHRFLIDLVSVLPDELGGLVDAFSQLTHYFPFSIPWDLFALLALFEHEPVTPVFDVPWGFGGDEGEVEMIRVDLSAWDGVMEMVRPVFLVGFCWQLAMITKELLANFDINKGGV